jgi:hypothetical protein
MNRSSFRDTVSPALCNDPSFCWHNEDQGSQLGVQELSIPNIDAEDESKKILNAETGKPRKEKYDS